MIPSLSLPPQWRQQASEHLSPDFAMATVRKYRFAREARQERQSALVASAGFCALLTMAIITLSTFTVSTETAVPDNHQLYVEAIQTAL